MLKKEEKGKRKKEKGLKIKMSLERKILGEQKISISFWVKSRFFFSLKKLFFF